MIHTHGIQQVGLNRIPMNTQTKRTFIDVFIDIQLYESMGSLL